MRDPIVDIIKGFLITMVVMGHQSEVVGHVVTWFHMPCFFMVGGFFLRTPASRKEWTGFAAGRARRLMVPYASYIVIVLAVFMIVWLPGELYLKVVAEALRGGSVFPGLMGPMWFMPVLFFSVVILSWLLRKAGPMFAFFAVALFYTAGHVESRLLMAHDARSLMPLSIDVCLMAVPYVWMGMHFYKVRGNIGPVHIIFSVAGLGMLAAAVLTGWEHFTLNMPDVNYTRYIYDIAVPMMAMILLWAFSRWVASMKRVGSFVARIGRGSISVFFLHPLVVQICWMAFSPATLHGAAKAAASGVTLLLAVFVPLALHALFTRWRPARLLLLGEK